MHSRNRAWLWLVGKEWRDLLTSRAWWVLVLAMGPLTGVCYLPAARAYAELSAGSGAAGGGGEALAPLTGVWAPTFSACELAAVFLLPFVAIRLVSADRQSGALKLELQQGMTAWQLIAAKMGVVLAAWLLAMLAPLSSLVVWKAQGGSLHGPEVAALVGGHWLNAGLTIALSTAMAALSEHPSTAAILTLGVTVGTWVAGFLGAVQGGWWERAAAYTPAAMVGEFQHGLVRLNVVLTALALMGAGFAVAAIWLHPGKPARRRAGQTAAALTAAVCAVVAAMPVRTSWDVSENRGNSFAPSDERALGRIEGPLRMEVHLAPEDPRRADLERQALSKLRRVLKDLRVEYVAASSTGLYEQAQPGYGEIRYEMEGRRAVSRAVTEQEVLEEVYAVAGVAPEGGAADPVYRGHPAPAPPGYAGALFSAVWPAVTALTIFLTGRKLK